MIENDEDRTASEAGSSKRTCFGWLSGKCNHGDDCPFEHEISKQALEKMTEIGNASVTRRAMLEMSPCTGDVLPETVESFGPVESLEQAEFVCRLSRRKRVSRPPGYYKNTSDRGLVSEDNGCNVSLVFDKG